MRLIACVNQKGGVGKTTVAANLAFALAQHQQKVLCIDLDPQGHLGHSLGVYDPLLDGIDAIFRQQASLNQVKVPINPNLDLIPAGVGLQKLEVTPMGKGKGLLLKKALNNQVDHYDYVILDCPPSSGFLVVNALACASELLIPVTPDYFGMAGLSQLMATVKNFERAIGNYRRTWLVVNRMQKRKLSAEVVNKLKHYFSDILVPVYLREKAVYAECPSHGKPVLGYAPRSGASRDIHKLSQFIMADRNEHEQK